MKKIKLIFSFVILLAAAISCSVPDGISQNTTIDKSITIGPVTAVLEVSNDNSGNVTITPTAVGPASYSVYFGDGTASPALVQFGANVVHQYKEGNYTIKVVANGLNGMTTEKTYPVSLIFRAPENLIITFTKNAFNLKVKASALYAASYLVYFGDAGVNEVGTPFLAADQISHNYTAVGTYNVKVIALSGGLAQTVKITPITINEAFALPITFENPNVVYSFVTSNSATFTVVPNPSKLGINTSATVGKFFKVIGAPATAATTSVLDTPINFSAGSKVRVWVYNVRPSDVGKKLTLELDSAVGGIPANGVAVLKAPITTSGAWEELVFDFSTIPAITGTTQFSQLVFRLNDTGTGKSETVYLDNIRLTN